MTAPKFTVICVLLGSRTSTKKSAVSSVGMTAARAVGLKIANDDGGVLLGNLFMNREIPCGTMPAN